MLGFVDDIKLIAGSRVQMKELIGEVEAWGKVTGMKLAGIKCAHATRGEKEEVERERKS